MFWEHDQLSRSAKSALLRVLNASGAGLVEPEHALLVLLEEEQAPFVTCWRKLFPSSQPASLHSAVTIAVRSPIASPRVSDWNERLLSPRFVTALRTAQSAVEWMLAGNEHRTQLICAALVDALKPSVKTILQAHGIVVDQLANALRGSIPLTGQLESRRPRSFPVSQPTSPPPTVNSEGMTPRNVGPIRSVPTVVPQGGSSTVEPPPVSMPAPKRGRTLPAEISSVPEVCSPDTSTVPIPLSSPSTPALPAGDEIQCTAFAPPIVKRGDSFLVQLFTHFPERVEEADRMAREFDDAAGQRGFSVFNESVRQGQILRFDFKVTGGTVDLESASLRWTGRTGSVQFLVTAGTTETLTALFARVTISLDSVPIGQIVFKVAIAAQVTAAPAEPLATSEVFQRYFISYATKDRDKVIPRVQMLPRMGKEFRQDLFDLEPGVRFERRLFEFIRECDATLVFWSANAKTSEWVLRECRFCIETKGIERLLPVIIERPPPLPPPELAELHMNDKLLYFITEP